MSTPFLTECLRQRLPYYENPDRLSAPFIAENAKLLARITVDDIVDESGYSPMSTAELDEALDMFVPAMTSAGRRAIWLGDTLPTTFLAS